MQGLSPKENRDVPPLRYEPVHRFKSEFPHLDININGGIKTLDAAAWTSASTGASRRWTPPPST
nr:hypothetical protein [Pyxidicoccus parkwaysis]